MSEERFSVPVGAEDVPVLVVRPDDAEGPTPLVFVQHPGMGSKEDPFVVGPARLWARDGWTCVGLDAPRHGGRAVRDPLSLFRGRTRFDPEVLDQWCAEVSAVIDTVAERWPVDLDRIGWVGFSLGAMLGVPAVARDGRFRAAAFCLAGEGLMGPATGPDSPVPGLAGVAVRIVGKERDEMVPRAATQALYDAVPGEKDLVWLPGGHFQIGTDVIDSAGDWLRAHL